MLDVVPVSERAALWLLRASVARVIRIALTMCVERPRSVHRRGRPVGSSSTPPLSERSRPGESIQGEGYRSVRLQRYPVGPCLGDPINWIEEGV